MTNSKEQVLTTMAQEKRQAAEEAVEKLQRYINAASPTFPMLTERMYDFDDNLFGIRIFEGNKCLWLSGVKLYEQEDFPSGLPTEIGWLVAVSTYDVEACGEYLLKRVSMLPDSRPDSGLEQRIKEKIGFKVSAN